MKRTAAIFASVALTLTLAACGSSSSSDTSSSVAPVESSAPAASTAPSAESSELVETPDRQTLIDELRADGEASGATAEQIDCVINAIESLDAGELQTIKDGTPSAETQEVMTAASTQCLPAPSPAAS